MGLGKGTRFFYRRYKESSLFVDKCFGQEEQPYAQWFYFAKFLISTLSSSDFQKYYLAYFVVLIHNSKMIAIVLL